MNSAITAALLLLLACGCEAQQPKTPAPMPLAVSSEAFAKYWYASEAEISSFDLTQWRYGQPREGSMVLIFVTEDFLPERQVKKETGNEEGVSVLKLNSVKRFTTGIYDYSIMGSTFTPIDSRKHPYTLKSVMSAQDWCGHSYTQVNQRDGKFQFEVRSYFQDPGDADVTLEGVYLEEDVWTRMRLNPQGLPLGKVELVPSQEFLRLNHHELKAYPAQAVLLLQADADKSEKYIYRITYPTLERTVEWHLQSKFPFQIQYWEERTRDGGKSSARLSKTLKNAYWKLNASEHSGLRDSLGVRLFR